MTSIVPLDKDIKSESELWPILDPDMRISPVSNEFDVILELVVILFDILIDPNPLPILPSVRVPTVDILK